MHKYRFTFESNKSDDKLKQSFIKIFGSIIEDVIIETDICIEDPTSFIEDVQLNNPQYIKFCSWDLI